MCRGNTIHTCRVGSGYSFHGASWVTGLEFWFRLRLGVFCRQANFGADFGQFWPNFWLQEQFRSVRLGQIEPLKNHGPRAKFWSGFGPTQPYTLTTACLCWSHVNTKWRRAGLKRFIFFLQDLLLLLALRTTIPIMVRHHDIAVKLPQRILEKL